MVLKFKPGFHFHWVFFLKDKYLYISTRQFKVHRVEKMAVVFERSGFSQRMRVSGWVFFFEIVGNYEVLFKRTDNDRILDPNRNILDWPQPQTWIRQCKRKFQRSWMNFASIHLILVRTHFGCQLQSAIEIKWVLCQFNHLCTYFRK